MSIVTVSVSLTLDNVDITGHVRGTGVSPVHVLLTEVWRVWAHQSRYVGHYYAASQRASSGQPRHVPSGDSCCSLSLSLSLFLAP